MNERHAKILDLLTEYKKIEVTRLSKLLNVSQVTIRKDLDQLEATGILIREHGYAKLNESDDINNRLAYRYDIKQKIAIKAADMVKSGETIMIESGSCCALLALEIAKNKHNVTIITNSAFIADYIRKMGQVKIILLGGEYQNESQVMVGPITKKCVETFFVDKLFIGTDGFSEKSGFTGNDFMRGETVKDMVKQANKVIVVTDSDKFERVGLVKLIETNEVSYVITDNKIPKASETYLIKQGVEVEIVD
ncbi:DeoR/GlpR family DNA-binding transcription regulator [Thomasclavelia sp.]|uniref:DeoR/GlpR family DNA-binding transcription regulator n=1 Tax=Thomasclavelia sp. TaxID=3025757 RepID=UPI0025CF80D9|nr:DeoR/GlpR family DNA-binding transcription regulator [Thomasclavelia sp.]